jgi:hypothetical protein
LQAHFIDKIKVPLWVFNQLLAVQLKFFG